MEEGTIVAWHVGDGAYVNVGQALAEVETDKATVSFEAEVEGSITVLVAEGETVPLGAVIARIDAPGDASLAAAGPAGATEDPARAAVAKPIAVTEERSSHGDGSPAAAPGGGQERPFASPLARRVAAALGVELRSISGSGPRGRIVKSDVERSAAGSARNGATDRTGDPAVAVGQSSASGETVKGTTHTADLSRTQQVIARRMSESRATVPDFTVEVTVDMEAAWALREQLKDFQRENDAIVPSFNDLVVFACGRALREQPIVNSSYRDGAIETFGRVNVGVAIASPGSLVVATVFDADQLSLGAIARTTRRLAAEVRDGTVTPPDLAGGTFTVSNLGMFGIDRFTAVINAPQAAILAVGAIGQHAVVRDGQLVPRRTMQLSLSADHRVLYGADGARFLARVKELLEQPAAALAGV
jgi:pyruvate dehydrogenase E2 component (dihydrolipoamide acetyltransferase)